MINNIEQTTVKIKAARDDIFPAGISLIAVRGFLASNFLSINRLNAMAALLAKTMHKITNNNFSKLKTALPECIARQNPTTANGKAKTVWLNFMRDKYF